jgi:nucleotide-binding universal stress UspA family protein
LKVIMMMSSEIPNGAVVVGIDGSQQALAAVEWATELATMENRPLALVHATSLPSPNWMGYWGTDEREFEKIVREAADQRMAEAVQRARQVAETVDLHQLVLVRDPRSALLDLSGAASTIVLGSRGLGPVRSLLLGSVGAALVRHAKCPVVVLRESRREPELGVVVGVDVRAATPAVLEFAFAQAAARKVSLTVVHVAADTAAALPAVYVEVSPTEEEMEAHRRLTAELISGMSERFPDVEVHTEVAHGHPQEFLTRLGDRGRLLVVGSHEGGHMSRALATAVVEHAHGTVAVVPAESETA